MKKKIAICLTLIIVLISTVVVITSQYQGKTSQGELLRGEVVRVIDGDTFTCMISKEETTIRLIGIDCPESVYPDAEKNSVEGIAASKFTSEQLYAGRTVWLEVDVQKFDIYGRTLAYVWLVSNPTEEEIKTQMFNAVLVTNGFADVVEYKPNTKYSIQFKKIEME